MSTPSSNSSSSKTQADDLLASRHSDDAHTVTLLQEPNVGPASSPPSSSPVVVTPPDCLEEEPCAVLSDGSSFLRRLDDLLAAHLEEKDATRGSTAERSTDWDTVLGYTGKARAEATLDSMPHSSRKRAGSESVCLPSDGPTYRSHGLPTAHKKRKLSKSRLRLSAGTSGKTGSGSVVRLSGAFKLQFARGPGSLRRAESLRSQPCIKGEQEVLNEVVDRSTQRQKPSRPIVPQDLPIILGNIASPFGGYAPTVPTTPTSNDTPDQTTCAQEQEPLVSDVPVISVPPFELIPKPPRSAHEAAERRIAALLSREQEARDLDGLQYAATPNFQMRRSEDEEERFWMHDSDDSENDDVHLWTTVVAMSPAPNTLPAQASHRAQICPSPIQLDIDGSLKEQVFEWLLEIMPAEEYKTSYSPGDLYDLLSSSPETRFHAGYLFLRYLLHVRSSLSPLSSLQTASQSSEDQEALEAVTWDVAVACLALSVKFHRDSLFPLDVIYVEEFLDMAPHEMEFEDLENAQRDVLEAIVYRVGSATPGAFMEELWDSLPTLQRLIAFDGGWGAVQENVWEILNDALQQPELLQYPLSLVTGAAVMEGILNILQRKYKNTGVDGRGKPVCKRDARSLRKVALKCSCGVRLDIQDLLEISNRDLLECRKWLGLTID